MRVKKIIIAGAAVAALLGGIAQAFGAFAGPDSKYHDTPTHQLAAGDSKYHD